MPLETIELARPAQASSKPSTFTASPEELRAIGAKMHDPTFVQLLHEYMQSLDDPDTRREEEAYLEQVEREAREGGDYSVEFIFPRARFAVELCQPTTRRVTARELREHGLTSCTADQTKHLASYVNVCASDKVDVFREETTGDRAGSNWHVPVSVSRKRVEWARADSAQDALCFVYDAVYHPNTLALADRSDRFVCFLVEIAVEHINAGYGESNGFEFRRLPSSVPCVGRPRNQTIRRKTRSDGTTTSPFAIQPNAPVLTKPTRHLPSVDEERDPTPQAKHTETPAAPLPHVDPAADAAASQLPPHTLVHRARVELADAWDWKVREQRVGVPEALVVTFDFADCVDLRHAAAIDLTLDAEGRALVLQRSAEQTRYAGTLALPFPVDDPPLKAQFERGRRRLKLVLRVRPPAPTQRTAREVRVELGLQPPESTTLDDKDVVRDTANAEVDAKTKAEVNAEANADVDTKAEAESTAQDSVPTSCAHAGVPPVLQDHARVQAMFEKVREARCAREAAAAAAAATHVDAAAVREKSSADTDSCAHVNSRGTPDETHTDDVATSAPDELAALQRRQDEWVARVRAEMTAAQESSRDDERGDADTTVDDTATACADKERRAQQQRQMQQLREAERIEAEAQAKMDALPLCSKFIFDID